MTLTQPYNTYLNTTANRREITDAILLLEPLQTPFIEWLGLSSAMSKFEFVGDPNTKIEWLQDTYRTLTDQLDATLATGDTALTVADADAFMPGDIILLPDATEKAWVSAIAAGATTITVTRGYGDTSPATQATGAITILSQARVEGDDSDFGPVRARTTDYNYVQKFEDAVHVTREQEKMAKYGIDSEIAYQEKKKVKELYRAVEKNMFWGERVLGTATTPSGSGGLGVYITSHTLSTAASSLVLANLESLVLQCHTDTGEVPDVMWMNPAKLQTLKNLYDNSSYLRIERDENSLGMEIQRLITPWTPNGVMFKTSIHCPTGKVYFLNSNYVGGYTYIDWESMDLPAAGYYAKRAVAGWFSLVVAQQKAHAILTLT